MTKTWLTGVEASGGVEKALLIREVFRLGRLLRSRASR